MTQTEAMTQTTNEISAPPDAPLALPYREAPTGAVVASDAALLAVKRGRPWALLLAIALFLYAVAGGVMGTIWLVALIVKFGQPNFPVGQFIVISTSNLLFSPIALIGGVLTMRYVSAAGRAYNGRSSEDLERSLIRQQHIWRWAAATVIAVLATPVIILFIAACLNLWP